MTGMHKIQFKWLAGIVAISACAINCCSQYQVLPGQANSDDCNPTSSARICLGAAGEAHCYAPPNDKYGSSDKEEYIFGLAPNAKAAGRFHGQELTLFTAMFSGCGSGTLTHLSLLTVRGGEFVNLLPKVELTNVSEYKLWTLNQFSSLPVFATADFDWEGNEPHFGAHRYHIEVYVFDPKIGSYRQLVRYITKRKSPGFDQTDEIHVLDAEKPAILARLRQNQSN